MELSPEGNILKVNSEGKKLLTDDNDSINIFHRIKCKEIKAKLHECFMGKINEFMVTIDFIRTFSYFTGRLMTTNSKDSSLHV